MISLERIEEARSVIEWVRRGWFVPLGYAVGFFTLLLVYGWNPIGQG